MGLIGSLNLISASFVARLGPGGVYRQAAVGNFFQVRLWLATL